jgi:hypothetical protein
MPETPTSKAFAAHAMTWIVLVAAPLLTAAVAWLWIEVCKAMWIPGMLLALPGFVAQVAVTYYAMPLRWLAPELCYTPAGSVVSGLPCDATTWLALAALYTLISLGLVAAARYVTTPSRP